MFQRLFLHCMIRREYRFIGRVQGVGFRYRCFTIAKRLGLTGFVKNEYDYSVTAQIQGEEAVIEKMIEQLFQEPFIHIEKIWHKDLVVIKSENSFEVRY